ncbi:MAG: hypothetical protein ACRCY7_00050 [Cetobacterium sp.]|uniref:hypothetical protein n=1 Tax=Cetobacterium sp. TaxID=2071632 RepID=UPI003F377B3C
MIYHTGEDASKERGNFECIHCHGIITMLGNYKDKFPPCPWEKIGTDYIKILTLQQGTANNYNTKRGED